MTIPTVSLDETSPAGSDQASQGDNRIREYKTQNREIMAIDHVYGSSGQSADNGKHKQISLLEQADLGSGTTGYAFLGGQTVSGKPELVYTDEDDNDVQITSGGDVCALGSGVPIRSGDLLLSSSTTTPTGWTDVSTTYDNKFIRIGDDTPLTTTGGSDTHDHGGTTGSHSITQAELPSVNWTVSVPFGTFSSGGGAGQSLWSGGDDSGTDVTISSGGSGTGHAHTISSVSNVPAYIQTRIYKKD